MRKIDTSEISPTADYPGLGNVGGESITGGDPAKMQGLDFLQQAALENAQGLALAMTPDSSKAIILSGCVYSTSGSGISIIGSITAGWVFYNGEVFPVQAGSGNVSFGYLNASWEALPTDASPNPLTELSDGSEVSIHNQRIVVPTQSLTPNAGNLPDCVHWIPNQIADNKAAIATNASNIATNTAAITALETRNKDLIQLPISPNTMNASSVGSYATLEDSGSNAASFTTPNDGITRVYRITASIGVTCVANNGFGSTFTARIAVGATYYYTEEIGFGASFFASPAGQELSLFVGLTVTVSIAPNTVIALQGKGNNTTNPSDPDVATLDICQV